MRFLLDQNVSPKVTASLRSLGHDAVDTRDLSLQRARDTTLWQRAGAEGRMLIPLIAVSAISVTSPAGSGLALWSSG